MQPSYDIDAHDLLDSIRRYLWLVIGVPLLTFGLLAYQARTAPFRSELKAVVLLPGDTEIPGRAERPELMIMDDLPTLVESKLFARNVAAVLQPEATDEFVDEVEASLSASRYSRVVTIVSRHDSADQALAISQAAERVLSQTVNEALITPGAPAATVNIIEPSTSPARGEPDQWRTALIVTAAMGFAAVLAAVFLDAPGRDERRRSKWPG